MPEIVDDKSQYCIPFILGRLEVHRRKHAGEKYPPPFFLGLNGVQGAGKTILVSLIRNTLSAPPHSLPTAVFSLDDVYLPHIDLLSLSSSYPENPLLQHRGQPSTHDLPLALHTFASFRNNQPTKIPAYDKSAFNGQGDRVPEREWEAVNQEGENKVKVVIFEGWAVGFRPLSDEALQRKWEEAVRARDKGDYTGRLGHCRLEDVAVVNEALKKYDELTDQLDALIHIDASDPQFVYQWRLDQEKALRASKGSGMTDEQVKHFVDGYYPSYELFTDTLREGIFASDQGRQLRLVVGLDRKVKEHMTI